MTHVRALVSPQFCTCLCHRIIEERRKKGKTEPNKIRINKPRKSRIHTDTHRSQSQPHIVGPAAARTPAHTQDTQRSEWSIDARMRFAAAHPVNAPRLRLSRSISLIKPISFLVRALGSEMCVVTRATVCTLHRLPRSTHGDTEPFTSTSTRGSGGSPCETVSARAPAGKGLTGPTCPGSRLE